MKIPTVALVGRPNVGKSTVFNRLVGKKISIIEDTPGVTRDRIYGDVIYKNYKFHLIDTGGIDVGPEHFNKEITIQASLAIDESDIIVFIVDGKEGLTAKEEKELAEKLATYKASLSKEEIDFLIDKLSEVISRAINKSLHDAVN